ncbi:YybS family protein [Anaerovorax odorimutans]|uniref:YybS family protein n=1 Tax=Anaerovorax odorimutans TaxID=109327 RepID=A0ABT1RQM3_9FIRM|nr:DUF2232 domain-containing protein [Anaerovorax odorimutans]MCQ4637490.1 YybS family protein [Anaerovorax odorimutans]
MYLTFIFIAALVLPVPVMIPAMGKKLSPYRVVLEGIFAGVIGSILIMIIASATGNGILDTIQESVRYMAQTVAKDPMIGELLGKETTETERVQLLIQVYGQAANLVPSTICIFTAIAAYIEYIILSRIVKPEGIPALRMPKFREFDLPRNVIIGWVVIFLLSWILAKTGMHAGELLYGNINALFNFVFCLQGMSVLFMFCYKRKAPKAIAVIIIIFFLFSGFGKLVLLILGFADVIFRLKEKLK